MQLARFYLTLTIIVVLLVITHVKTLASSTITASSGQGNYSPSLAMDGKMNTRWSSEFTDEQWLEVIFDKPREFVGLTLHWETAYGRDYNIDILDLDDQWVSVNKTRSSDGGIDAIYFGVRKAKGFRLIGLKRGTGWGYSLWDIELLGIEYQRYAKASSQMNGHSASMVMDGNTDTYWQSNSQPPEKITIVLTSPQIVEIGGLKIDWAQQQSSTCLVQAFSEQENQWQTLTNKKAGVSNSEDIFFKATSTKQIRLLFPAKLAESVRIAEIQFKQPAESWTPVRHFEMLAQRMPDGMFPGWLRREQIFWTVTGLPGSFNESLLDEHGRVESGLRNFSVTSLLVVDGKIRTAKSFKTTQSLADDWAPVPSVQWQGKNLNLNITANTIQPDTTLVLYTLKNIGKNAHSISLLLAVRPLPVNPPWQHGGHITLNQAQWSREKNTLILNNTEAITVVPNPSSLSLYAQQPLAESVDITELLLANETQGNSVTSSQGLVSAGMRYDYNLKPGETRTILAIYPNTSGGNIDIPENREAFFSKELDKSLKLWRKLTGDWDIDLPDKRLSNIIRSNLAYLLINADGPATQPGSRNYNSSWIRDGAISATAMIRFGLIEPGVNYLKWITDIVRDDGFVPFIVETKTGKMEGFANNWQEYDSFGEYVFIARQAIETINDDNLAKLCWPKVKATMKYMENLRNQRLTEKYKGTEYEGILPESQSHEGYIDPPRHSYWDDFFAIKGIQDARAIALRLGHNKDAEWLAEFENDMRASILTSIERVRKRDGLATLPACAELGDFDPTSTAIGVMIADERDTLPADALKATFDRYMQESRHRAAQPLGTRKTYTPYEVRNISAMIRLGRPDDAIMLTDYFIEDAVRPAGWNHMAEVVHTDPRVPSYIGDMPHTWVGAGFINAVRDILVYEERDQLVLAAAIPDHWLDEGITVRNLQTWWGPISYELKRQGDGQIVLDLEYSQFPPKGFKVPKYIKLKAVKKKSRCELSDSAYIKSLYAATLKCIDHFTCKETNLPYDGSDQGQATSITNIGFYMASIAIASETGLIEKSTAKAKLSRAFDSLEKIQKWHGFPITWVDVQSLKRAHGPSFSYADHVGNLICSLLVTSATFPEEFQDRVDNFIATMDFKATYDPATGWLKGGYNLEKNSFDIDQPGGKWYYDLLASDTRSFSLAGIALKQIPRQHWSKLNQRELYGPIDHEIAKIMNLSKPDYLSPGIQGGGLFMQYISGIFITEKDTRLAQSAKNFAAAQIALAKHNHTYPIWGISACQVPNGETYLGWASLDKYIVTPHASVLAIEHFPSDTINNLRALEKHNVWPLYKGEYDFGFTDSFDCRTHEASQKYLILDQTMLFLSLANHIHNNIVRIKFNQTPLGSKINKTLTELENVN